MGSSVSVESRGTESVSEMDSIRDTILDLDSDDYSDGEKLNSIKNKILLLEYSMIRQMTYTAVLLPEYSNMRTIYAIVRLAQVANKMHGITGIMTIDRFSETQYFIEQTIEGPVKNVSRLYENIKKDLRVDSITSTYTNNVFQRRYKEWTMRLCTVKNDPKQIAPHFEGDFVGNYTNIQILRQTETKNVFVVRCRGDEKFYVLKETSSDEMNRIEYNVLKRLARFDRPFIQAMPNIQYSEERISALYPLYEMDMATMVDQFRYKRFHMDGHIVRCYYAQLAEILFFLARHEIVHRDICMENMFINRHGDIVLSDFESAVTVATARRRTFLVGDSRYHAPEIFQTSCYSVATDMWAAGVVMYQLISSTMPWGNLDTAVQLERHREKFCAAEMPGVKRPVDCMNDSQWEVVRDILVPAGHRVGAGRVREYLYFADIDFDNIFGYKPEFDYIVNFLGTHGMTASATNSLIVGDATTVSSVIQRTVSWQDATIVHPATGVVGTVETNNTSVWDVEKARRERRDTRDTRGGGRRARRDRKWTKSHESKK